MWIFKDKEREMSNLSKLSKQRPMPTMSLQAWFEKYIAALHCISSMPVMSLHGKHSCYGITKLAWIIRQPLN
jgi:hypothetical protein